MVQHNLFNESSLFRYCYFFNHLKRNSSYLSSFLDSLFDLSRSFALSLAASRFSSPAKPNPPRLLISSTSFRIGLGARREFPSPPPRRRGRHPLTVRPRSTSTRTRLPSIFRPSAYLYAPKYLLIYKGLIKVQTHSGVLFMTSYIVTSQLSLRWNVSYPNLPDFCFKQATLAQTVLSRFIISTHD